MDYFFLYLISISLTFILCHSEILDILKIRPFLFKWEFFRKLLRCSFCTSVYVGIFLTLLFIPFGKMWIIFPLTVCPIVFLWDRFVIYLDERIIELENKRNGK